MLSSCDVWYVVVGHVVGGKRYVAERPIGLILGCNDPPLGRHNAHAFDNIEPAVDNIFPMRKNKKTLMLCYGMFE
jgi:hypothetical protein